MIRLRKIFRNAILITGVVFTFSAAKAQTLADANYLTMSEQYSQAADIYKNVLLAKEPNNGVYYLFYGENVIKEYVSDTLSVPFLDMIKNAKTIFNEGTVKDPLNPLNFIGLGRLEYLQGNAVEAEKYFAQAKALLKPYTSVKKLINADLYTLALAKMAEAYIYNETIDTAKAFPLIRESISINEELLKLKKPNKYKFDVYITIGDVYLVYNDASNAIKYYNKANEVNPKSPVSKIKIGNIYVRSKNLQAAIPYFEEAITIDANYSPAYRELAELYQLAGRFENAKTNYKKYLELSGDNTPAKIKYIGSLYRAKDYNEAIVQIEEVFKVDTSINYLNRLAAYCYYESPDADHTIALKYIEKFFNNTTPDRIIYKDYLYWGRIILKTKSEYSKNSVQIYKDTSRLSKDISKVSKDLLALNNIRNPTSTNNKDKAVLSARLDSLNNEYKTLSSTISADLIEIDRGFSKFQLALDLQPNSLEILNEMAINYYNFKKYANAADTYKKINELSTPSLDNLMIVGKCYYQAKEYKLAESAFEDIVNTNPDYIPGYYWIAATNGAMDPDSKLGMAKPKYELLIQKASVDKEKNVKELFEAYRYLASYYTFSAQDYPQAHIYINEMLNIDPQNVDYQIKAYTLQGIVYSNTGAKDVPTKMQLIESAIGSYKKILELDPENKTAKTQIRGLQQSLDSYRSGVNPNEISGVVKDPNGNPVPAVSIRAKDASNETYTGANGAYKFEIPKSCSALIVTAKGYKTIEIPVNESRVYNITLRK